MSFPLSLEFFPPKTPEGAEKLRVVRQKLYALKPEFCSVTYGAGGSTRDRTHRTVVRMLKETTLKPAAHLTCVEASRAEVDEVVQAYWDAGIRHIVALRGDPPEGVGSTYAPHPGGYAYASDLVAGIASIGGFEISVGAYPERHPESPTWDVEIDNLKRKVDAGATRAITQFFFDNSLFYRYRDLAAAAGVTIPIVPGVVPVQNFKQTAGFARRTGAGVPEWLAERFEGLDDDLPTRRLVAAAVAAEQVLDLIDHGVADLHFYTMNKADLVYAICHLIGMRPDAAAAHKAA